MKSTWEGIRKKAVAHPWRCRANRSAALIAGALSANRLPEAKDLKAADVTAALMTLARIKREPTPVQGATASQVAPDRGGPPLQASV
jgi:hypothetical protein